VAGAPAYVDFVRSTVAHAKISGIDTSAAKDARASSPSTRPPTSRGRLSRQADASFMNQAMCQPVLDSDTVRFVGEPGRPPWYRGDYQGEDAIELSRRRLRLLPAVVNIERTRRPAARMGCWSPRPGNQRDLHVRRRVRGELGPVRGLRGRGQREPSRTPGRPGPDGDPRAAAAWGERRAADRLAPQSGRPGHQGDWCSALGVEADVGADHHPRRTAGFGAKFGPSSPEAVETCWIAKQLAARRGGRKERNAGWKTW